MPCLLTLTAASNSRRQGNEAGQRKLVCTLKANETQILKSINLQEDVQVTTEREQNCRPVLCEVAQSGILQK